MDNIDRLPLITTADKVWEKQSWDTQTSYNYFLLYYLPQKSGTRTVAQAYREAYPQKANKKRGSLDAPNNWYRWASGKDSKGRQKFYRLKHPSGKIDVLPVPTWEQRAGAWDSQIYADALEKAAEEEAQMISDMRKMVRVAFIKTFDAWHKFNPSGQEKITELSNTTRNLTAVMQDVFGIFTDEEDEKDSETTAVDDKNVALTDMQRVNEIARILDKVRASKDASPNP